MRNGQFFETNSMSGMFMFLAAFVFFGMQTYLAISHHYYPESCTCTEHRIDTE